MEVKNKITILIITSFPNRSSCILSSSRVVTLKGKACFAARDMATITATIHMDDQ